MTNHHKRNGALCAVLTHKVLGAVLLVLALAACSGKPPAPAAATVTVAASLSTTPLDGDTSGDLGEENGGRPSYDLLKGAVGQPLHLVNPIGRAEADWTVNSFSFRKPHGNYSKVDNGSYLVADITVRVTKGKWEVNSLDLSVVPDADTGTPKYSSALMVDGMGEHDLYSGVVPAGKHITGEVYFDVPKGNYWMYLNEGNFQVGMFDIAMWRYER